MQPCVNCTTFYFFSGWVLYYYIAFCPAFQHRDWCMFFQPNTPQQSYWRFGFLQMQHGVNYTTFYFFWLRVETYGDLFTLVFGLPSRIEMLHHFLNSVHLCITTGVLAASISSLLWWTALLICWLELCGGRNLVYFGLYGQPSWIEIRPCILNPVGCQSTVSWLVAWSITLLLSVRFSFFLAL
jgi:hypothetical protein